LVTEMPLRNDSPEKWECKEHSRVKHEILEKYLGAWIRIVGTYHNLIIFDCFAGRGKNSDGSDGSPLIIIKKLAEIHEERGVPKEASCIFIEKNENNFYNLEGTIEQERHDNWGKYNEWLRVRYFNNEFVEVSRDVIDNYRENLAPSFFFLDPFGFSGIPFEIIKEILSIEKTEIFITFMVRDVVRFLSSSSHRISIEELYGISNVSKIIETEYPNFTREQALLRLYLDRLRNDACVNYPFPFKVNADEQLRTAYYLIHCTNHPKGCEVMKEIMYSSGTRGRYGYFGPAEGQLSLDQANYINELKELLIEKFKGMCLDYGDVRYQTLLATACIKRNFKQAILELRKEKKVEIEGMGSRGGLPDNAQISFLKF
jgi:three-Cys-motif partner protein